MRLPGIPDEALDLENRGTWAMGQPTLFAAFEILRKQWRAGHRERELGLHLLFLSWYMLLEPAHLTGFDEALLPTEWLAELFNEVHEYLGPANSNDPELLYVVGLIAHLSPWLLGDNSTWEHRSESYRATYRQVVHEGIDSAMFNGRGAYGEYFAGQARVVGGF